jgi:hypothetical protein
LARTDLAQMRSVDDQDPVKDLTAHATDPALHDRVHARRLRNGEHDTDAFGAQHLIEQPGEPAVPVANQQPQ